MVSSVCNQGIDELLREIAGTLVPELPPDGQPIPVTADQIQWLRNLQQQLS